MPPTFWRLISLGAVILCGAASAPAQPIRAKDIGVGKILVAARDFPDATFAGTVILIVRYGPDGALGLALNRPTPEPISRVLQDFDAAKDRSDPVFLGGPVGRKGVFALVRSNSAPEEAVHVFSTVYWVSTKSGVEKTLAAKGGPSERRIYLGYSGWGPGQLENELRVGAWHIVNGVADRVFDSDPASLWSRMIALSEQQVARFSIR